MESKNAVFLSYASEDAEVALKICTTLSADGIEVWFDQSELRGGDAWVQESLANVRRRILITSRREDSHLGQPTIFEG